jgi:hypothetical protein
MMTTVPDMTGNSIEELGVFADDPALPQMLVRVLDPATKSVVKSVQYPK